MTTTARNVSVQKKTVHGVTIGIMMVNTGFRRFVGDVGHAETWTFPVQYLVVRESSPALVSNMHKESLLEPFKRAADQLIADGVAGITTSCGYLSLYQRELAEHCSVPVATSSLLQIPMIERLLPKGKRVGILTYEALGGPYFDAVGIPHDTPVQAMPPASRFIQYIKNGDPDVPFDLVRDEVVAGARKLIKTHPDVGAIVLECTNLSPYAYYINRDLGIPVYDIVTMINWFHAGLRPTRFS